MFVNLKVIFQVKLCSKQPCFIDNVFKLGIKLVGLMKFLGTFCGKRLEGGGGVCRNRAGRMLYSELGDWDDDFRSQERGFIWCSELGGCCCEYPNLGGGCCSELLEGGGGVSSGMRVDRIGGGKF